MNNNIEVSLLAIVETLMKTGFHVENNLVL